MIIKKTIGTYSLKASKLQICEWSNLHTKYPQKKKGHENGIKKLHASIHVYFTCMQHTYKYE